ncbi:MAG: glycogen operon protein GlgX [Agathobacter sp.]|nr:glycogen operon protein GlgX [Agathobacter sp.]
MVLDIKKGDFSQMGVRKIGKHTIFTFEGKLNSDCHLVLVNRFDKEDTKVTIPAEYCLGSLCSVDIVGLDSDFLYYYEIDGTKYLDPYATIISGREKWNDLSRQENDYSLLCGVSRLNYKWSNDRKPCISKQDMNIYKLHVRGVSMDTDTKHPGTFTAVKSRIPYIKKMGFNTIELMPVYEFEEMNIPEKKPDLPDYINWESSQDDIIVPWEEDENTEHINKPNFWGYTEGNYFSVKASYASNPLNAGAEFASLIKLLHNNNMQCIMEIFFPAGINHNLIIDALHFWVMNYHVDGFHILGDDLPVTAIVQDPMLSCTKIMYHDFTHTQLSLQKGKDNLFIYNDEYIYPSRKILNHMNGELNEFLNQQKKQGNSNGFINYVANNNGFSLADVFMYNDKHNEDNGEYNQDGSAWNFSNNYGIEGPTNKKFIKTIRRNKWRNSMMMLFLAQGVPLLWSGDEIGNSQKGNNNAYCQDNPVGWINWKNGYNNKSNTDFIKNLITFRNNHPVISSTVPYRFCDYKGLGFPDVSYHGDSAWLSEFHLNRMSVGIMYCGLYSPDKEKQEFVYIGYNFYSYSEKLALPKLKNKMKWYLVADSGEETGFLSEPALCDNQNYVEVFPQSICILVGK